MKQRTYIAIDLKSFYASVECMSRGLDPLTTNLVVADIERTEKTICLAVSPSLKAYGIPGRARLFQVSSKVREVNAERLSKAPGRRFSGKSYDSEALSLDRSLSVDYIVARPRMAEYMKISSRIYNVYLRFIAPEDIHVYSIDEVLMDVTDYLNTYGLSPRALASKMVQAVYEETHITATAGIGTNLYLCKVALDIMAKHAEPDENGVRIGELTERTFREKLWAHEPLTDFWRIGAATARKLQENGLRTMGDIALCSVGGPRDFYNEDLLYKLFGIQAELLIDHAWGYEPALIKDIKGYVPENNCLTSGQVLTCHTDAATARLNVREMVDLLALSLVEKGLVTKQVVLDIGYDIENLTDSAIDYMGPVVEDRYGRRVPKPAHGSGNLAPPTASSRLLTEKASEVYDAIVNPGLYVRRLNVTFANVTREEDVSQSYEQLSLFTDIEEKEKADALEQEKLDKEKKLQLAAIELKKRFGKNAILKGMNLQEGATTIQRNSQIGGHHE